MSKSMIVIWSVLGIIVVGVLLNVLGIVHWKGVPKTEEQKMQEQLDNARPFDKMP